MPRSSERWGDVLATWRRRPLEAWAPGGESIPDVVSPAPAGARRRSSAKLAAAGVPGTLDRPQVAGYRESPDARSRGRSSSVTTGVFKVLLLTLFDLPLERFWMWSFDLCGIGVIEFRAGRPLVRAMNLTEHLAPLLDEAAQEAGEQRQEPGSAPAPRLGRGRSSGGRRGAGTGAAAGRPGGGDTIRGARGSGRRRASRRP